LKTYNDRRGILSTFLKFAFQRSWIVDNPIFKVPHHRIRRRSGSAATLTAAQARDLMEHLESFEGGRVGALFRPLPICGRPPWDA